MKYKIKHTTRYEYSDNVAICQNLVHLTPRDTRNQHCIRHRLTVRPQPAATHRRQDYFGNTTTLFSIDKSHQQLEIVAASTLRIDEVHRGEASESPAWDAVRDQLAADRTAEGLDGFQFAFASRHVPSFPALTEYSRKSFPAGRPIVQALEELNRRIYEDFTYDPQATTVSTPIEEVFEKRRGVCQDLAHLMIGSLRGLGVASRYVSGYLRTHPPADQQRLVGADASHAWVSVYCGDQGWLDLDPTNNVFPSNEHLTIAWGRDYADVCPVAGMFVGGGSHKLSVAVDVKPMDY